MDINITGITFATVRHCFVQFHNIICWHFLQFSGRPCVEAEGLFSFQSAPCDENKRAENHEFPDHSLTYLHWPVLLNNKCNSVFGRLSIRSCSSIWLKETAFINCSGFRQFWSAIKRCAHEHNVKIYQAGSVRTMLQLMPRNHDRPLRLFGHSQEHLLSQVHHVRR